MRVMLSDGRLYQEGWDKPGFANASVWSSVATPKPAPSGQLSGYIMPPIRAKETFTAVDVWSPSAGVFMVGRRGSA